MVEPEGCPQRQGGGVGGARDVRGKRECLSVVAGQRGMKRDDEVQS